MLAGICSVVYFAAAFITQALHCRALNSLFRSIAESYSTTCTQRLAWITKPWMSCFPLKRWHGQPTCLQKVSLGYQPLQNRTSEKPEKQLTHPKSDPPFFLSSPGKGEMYFFPAFPHGSSPLPAMAWVTRAVLAQPDSFLPAAARREEATSGSPLLETSLLTLSYSHTRRHMKLASLWRWQFPLRPLKWVRTDVTVDFWEYSYFPLYRQWVKIHIYKHLHTHAYLYSNITPSTPAEAKSHSCQRLKTLKVTSAL